MKTVITSVKYNGVTINYVNELIDGSPKESWECVISGNVSFSEYFLFKIKEKIDKYNAGDFQIVNIPAYFTRDFDKVVIYLIDTKEKEYYLKKEDGFGIIESMSNTRLYKRTENNDIIFNKIKIAKETITDKELYIQKSWREMEKI